MIKGLSKQVVHPMDSNKNGDFMMVEGEEDNSQRQTDSSSEAGVSAMETTKVVEISAGSQSSGATVKPVTSRTSDNNSRNGSSGNNTKSKYGDDNTATLKSSSAYNGDAPHSKQKTGRKLTFADESGGDLAEISYSSRTHYNKAAGSGALGAGKGCCIIM